jgi:hypothetical protein
MEVPARDLLLPDPRATLVNPDLNETPYPSVYDDTGQLDALLQRIDQANQSVGCGLSNTVSAGEAGAADSSSVRDILNGLRAGRSENVYEVDTPEELRELFGRLSEGGEPLGNNYPGDFVRLPDGSTVGLRGASKSGGPAIDITRPGHPPTKIHLP